MSQRKVKYIYSDNLIKQADRNPAVKGRAALTHELMRSYGLLEQLEILPPKICNPVDLRNFHSRDYIDELRKCGTTANKASDEDEDYADVSVDEEFGLGFDCPTWNGVIDYVCHIAGATMTACEKLCKHRNAENPPIVINWTGGWHHAQRDKAAGFCYINDIVLGILVLRKCYQRILYIDLDVHHGDGVEQAFEVTRRVFTLSFHKYECGYYPGSGAVNDCGRFAKGYAANFPYCNGIDGEQFQKYFKRIFEFIALRYRPDACVVQCGADVVAGDPLGGTKILPSDVCQCVLDVIALNVPTLLLGGGGYNFPNASRLWTEITAAICGQQLNDDIPGDDAFFLQYGPDFSLKLSKPLYLRDENSLEYLEDCVKSIQNNLNKYNLSAV